MRGVAGEKSVLVAGPRCSESGCSPVETCISALGGEGTRLHKPVADVAREDVEHLVKSDSELSVGDCREG